MEKVTNKFKYINERLGGFWVGGNISYSEKQIDRAKCLLDKYISELSFQEQKEATSLHFFNAARMYHYLLMYPKAKKYYLESLNTAFLSRKIKAITGYLMCCIKIK